MEIITCLAKSGHYTTCTLHSISLGPLTGGRLVSEKSSMELSDLSPEIMKKFNSVCERFEAVWRGKTRPRIEDFLSEDHQGYYPNLVRELIRLEVDYRRRAGDVPRPEEYAQRFPDIEISWLGYVCFLNANFSSGEKETAEHIQKTPLQSDDNLPIQSLTRYQVKKIIGKGGFGQVYLAYDDQLQRHVAIKVPHRRLVTRPEDAKAYLAEARIVAGLDHPNIVPVHDVGSTKDCPFFIVSKFIEGSTLASEDQGQPVTSNGSSPPDCDIGRNVTLCPCAKELFIGTSSRATSYSTPAGKPYVADFGLALKEEDVGQWAEVCRHARLHESRASSWRRTSCRWPQRHLQPRRRLLRVAHWAPTVPCRISQDELLEQITSLEARPPRQWVDTIPNELERICLKALSKRASERYTTGKDMADDLRHFL